MTRSVAEWVRLLRTKIAICDVPMHLRDRVIEHHSGRPIDSDYEPAPPAPQPSRRVVDAAHRLASGERTTEAFAGLNEDEQIEALEISIDIEDGVRQ